jgi:peptidoglycan/xylan/chitin deacetylase (PgdA/CDA1 family)
MFRKFVWTLLNPRFPLLTPTHHLLMRGMLGARGLIFMLHRVCGYEKGRLAPNENLKVPPDVLEQTICSYKKRGFRFISVDELADGLKVRKWPDQPFVVMTLDDGYGDNFENAFPIFARHEVPFAIYVASDFVGNKKPLWWHVLEDLLLASQHVKLLDGEVLACGTQVQKESAFMRIRELVMNDPAQDPLRLLTGLFSESKSVPYVGGRQLMMSWRQIKEISKHPLCTIGGHTMTHPACKSLPEDKLREEISGGLRMIESQIGKRVRHFAFPYGTPGEIGKRELEIIRAFAFKTVSRVGGGVVTAWNSRSAQALPRVPLV